MKKQDLQSEFLIESGRRLKKYIESQDLSQTDLANKFNLSQSAFSNIFKGKTGISSKMIFLFKENFDIDFNWLFRGSPSKMPNKQLKTANLGLEESTAEYGSLPTRIDILEKELAIKNQLISLLEKKVAHYESK